MKAMHPINEQCFRYFAEIIHTCKSTNSPEKVLSLIVDRIVRSYNCSTCAVVLIDPKTEYLRIDNCHNLSLTFCNAFRRRITTTAIGRLLWTGKPILVRNSATDQAIASQVELENHFSSCLLVQIAVDQRTLGYLHCDSAEPDAFDAADIEYMQLMADIAGLALIKGQLFEENMRLDRIDHETEMEKYVAFQERMRGTAERAKQLGEDFTVLILDVDNFKDTVNTYGYETSRQLLKEMGKIIRGQIRPVDAAGRYGFDEFVMLRANANLQDGMEFANRLRDAIAGQSYTNRSIRSSVSIGVASYPRHGGNADAIMGTAKQAVFEAQRAGRNTAFCFKDEWSAGAQAPAQLQTTVP
jgi:two-component system, cell cycle response regulator